MLPGACNRPGPACVVWQEEPALAAGSQARFGAAGLAPSECRAAVWGSFGEASVTAKTIPRHAKALPRQRWVAGPREAAIPAVPARGIPEPGLLEGRVRDDPFTGPVAITQRAVLGDRIRRPTAWCEMASCLSRYDDPAALGEADIRARALAAGWRHDAVGRLVCGYCQQRNPGLWVRYSLVPEDRAQARRPGRDGGHARAGRFSAVWTALLAWHSKDSSEPGPRPRWPRLLVALAADRNGWTIPPPGPATSPPSHGQGAGPARPGWPQRG
jgi:hypothetical protein